MCCLCYLCRPARHRASPSMAYRPPCWHSSVCSTCNHRCRSSHPVPSPVNDAWCVVTSQQGLLWQSARCNTALVGYLFWHGISCADICGCWRCQSPSASTAPVPGSASGLLFTPAGPSAAAAAAACAIYAQGAPPPHEAAPARLCALADAQRAHWHQRGPSDSPRPWAPPQEQVLQVCCWSPSLLFFKAVCVLKKPGLSHRYTWACRLITLALYGRRAILFLTRSCAESVWALQCLFPGG